MQNVFIIGHSKKVVIPMIKYTFILPMRRQTQVRKEVDLSRHLKALKQELKSETQKCLILQAPYCEP